MRRRLRPFFLSGFLVSLAIAAPAQTPPNHAPSPVAQIRLGQSAVPLYGPWKFTVGDSPIDPKTGQPLWAQPGFDDSKWETVDLTPKDGAFDPSTGQSGYVPGWTAKGHPGYWGYAWYRIRIRVQARVGQELALAGPADVDDAYQVFDNGELAGHFGDFRGGKPMVYYAKPQMFPLAQPDSAGPEIGSPAEQTRVLAFRLWMDPFDLAAAPDVGGMHSAPVLGEAGAVAAGYQMRWLEIIRADASRAALALLFGLLAVVAISLILFDRSDRVYLWIGTLFLLLALYNSLEVIANWTELLSVPVSNLLQDGLAGPQLWAAWVMVFWVWFGLKRPQWLPGITAGLTLLLAVSTVLGEEVFFGLVPHAVAVHFVTVALVLQMLLFGMLIWVVVEGIRRRGIEGWLVLPLVALRGIGTFSFPLLHIRTNWYPFGILVHLGIISSLLVAVVIALLLLRRLLQSVKRQREMAMDVKQAQEVQRVILPEAHMALPGLAIESVYRPAREVGGDFFQIIPNPTDGSVMIVAGDVAGKGLPAGMLVALLVGAIRSIAQFNPDPAVMLQSLNQRLIGRNSAATCLALRIATDGQATLANAGHLPPWLNGHEIEMEGALPLGLYEAAEPSLTHFQLHPIDKLVLISDGILEAANEAGQLFGFDRIQSLLAQPTTAAQLADQAQSFGQNDDISVITLTRTAILQPA